MPKKDNIDIEEDYIDEAPDEDYSLGDAKSSENVNSNISASDFDPERVLYDIKKVFNGFDKRDREWVRVSEPLARSEFINLYINSLRSLVNFHNLFSQTSGDEAAFNMLESLKEITYAAVDYGILEEHIETFINIYDTLKNTFYGIIISGRGTENVKQVLTSVYQDLTKLNKDVSNDSFINWDKAKKYINS